jgi:hypothetical protein
MSSSFSKSSLTRSLSRNDSMVSQQSASSDLLRGFNGSEVHIPPPPPKTVTMMTAPYQQQPPHPHMMAQQMMAPPPPRQQQQQQQQQYPPNMPLFQQYLEPEINQMNQKKNNQKEMLLFSELKDHQNEVRKIRTSRDLARESSRMEGGGGIGGFFTSMMPRSGSSSPIPMQPQGTEMVGMRSQLQQQPPPLQQPQYMQQVQQAPYYNGGPVIMQQQQQSQQYRHMSEHSERYMDDSQSRSRDPGVVAAPFHSHQQYNTSRYSSLERPPPPSQQYGEYGRPPQQHYSAQYYNDQSQYPQQQQQQQQSHPPATQYPQQYPPQQFQPNHQPSSDYISFASVPVDYSGQGHHI